MRRFFPGDKEVRAALYLKMIEVLEPHLKSLGFSFVGRPSKKRFKVLWIRDRGSALDAIEFQWNTLDRPSFILNFRSFDHPDDLVDCRQNPGGIHPADFGMRAFMKSHYAGWFKPSWIKSKAGFAEPEIDKVVASAKLTLTEISDFLLGGPPSALMMDSSNWLDRRLPDNPPPWTEVPSPIGSNYHLPSRRAFSGKKLSAWYTAD